MRSSAYQAVGTGIPRPVSGDKQPLQVRLPTAVKRKFKAHAALRGLEPNELFVEVWEHYEQTVIALPGDLRK